MTTTHIQTAFERFLAIMGNADSWSTIDELVDACDKAHYWDKDFQASVAVQAKKAKIRHLIKKAKDGEGFPVWASVEATNEDGKTVRLYKQEALFDVNDYRQVTEYHADRSHYHKAMARSYAKRCRQRFGVQLRLNFDERKAEPNRRKKHK